MPAVPLVQARCVVRYGPSLGVMAGRLRPEELERTFEVVDDTYSYDLL